GLPPQASRSIRRSAGERLAAIPDDQFEPVLAGAENPTTNGIRPVQFPLQSSQCRMRRGRGARRQSIAAKGPSVERGLTALSNLTRAGGRALVARATE